MPPEGRKRSTQRQPVQAQRLSRDDWLRATLRLLKRGSVEKLRIGLLAEALKVTKGSFYWHFENWADFVKALLEYWEAEFTVKITEAINQVDGTAEGRLLALSEMVTRSEAASFDLAMHTWAQQDEQVAKVVRKVEKIRLDVVRALFVEMGFEEDELGMRVRTFVLFYSFQWGLSRKESEAVRLRHLKLRHAMLVRKP